MSGASDISSGLSVSSWGWTDGDGHLVPAANATFRLWSVRNKEDERIAMLLLPPCSATDALMVAYRAFVDAD